MKYLVALGIALFIVFYPSHPDRFRDQEFLMLLLTSLGFSGIIGIRLKNWFIIPALFYTVLSGLWIFGSKISPYGNVAFLTDGPSAMATVSICLVTLLVSYSNSYLLNLYFWVFECLAYLSSFLILFGHQGALDCLTIDSSMIAMVLPYIWFKAPKNQILRALVVSLPLTTVLVAKGATGVLALVSVLGIYFIRSKQKVMISSIAVLIIAIGFLTQGSHLVDPNGRLFVWKLCMKWWWENINPWIGTGLGTFQVVGVDLQTETTHRHDAFGYLHNEYLQILFEQGFIGLLFAGLIWAQSLWKAFKRNSWVFYSLIATTTVMFTQSPLRILVMAFYVALLVKKAHSLEPQSQFQGLSTPDWKEQNRLIRYVYDAQ